MDKTKYPNLRTSSCFDDNIFLTVHVYLCVAQALSFKSFL